MMHTFYKPGIFEIALHGLLGRHSWFMDRFQDRFDYPAWSFKCRICLIDQPGAPVPVLEDDKERVFPVRQR